MSQDVSTTMNKIEMDAVPAEEGAVGTAVMNPEFHPDTFSVDNYADRLMDEVFTGVDHLLETGHELEEELPEAEPASVQTIQMPDVAPLSIIEENKLAETEADTDEADAAPEPVEKKQADWTLRILGGLALASMAGAAAVVATQWQSYRTLYLQLTNPGATQTIATPVAAVESPNQQFATYVQRSLEVLKDQTAINQANGRIASASPSAVLQVPPAAIPTVASAPSVVAPVAPIAPAAAPPQSGTVIERIYIPVYQTPNGYVPVDPNTQISPEVAAAGIPRTTQAQPGNGQAIASATQTSQAAQQAGQSEGSFIAQPAPIVEHTLVGLLELGNSSAALFEVEGVTRRFSLGERVGGWTLAEVKNGEALLRRDGEVRSVFVGQTF